MEKTLICEIKECIEQAFHKGIRKFIIFPFGDVGIQVKNILNAAYGIEEDYIIDNRLSKFHSNIKPIEFLCDINCDEYALILASTNPEIYLNLKENAMKYIKENNVLELSSMKSTQIKKTKTGKYSYGPLCDHWLVESVGAFCSFAAGTDVVENHAVKYVSTHPFLYMGRENNDVYDKAYDDYHDEKWYFEGVLPKGRIEKIKKINIGNDVWLAKNVIITNGANIGNGVIAGAGAVITKDIPDYAVVVGVPARIIRYRFAPDQIIALNNIKWWNWSDDQIRERYDDFYLPIEKFVEKYNPCI